MAFLGIKYKGIQVSTNLGQYGITTPSASYQPESVAYFTAIEDAGGTLTNNVKAEFNAFVVREKDASRWSKLKRLYPFLGGKANSAIIDAVTTNSATNNNFLDADADDTCGLQGDGTTKYLEGDNYNAMFASPYKSQQGYFTIGTPDTTSTLYHIGALDGTVYWLATRNQVAGVYRHYFGQTSANQLLSGVQGLNSSVITARFSQTSAYGITNGTEGVEYTTSVTYTLPSVTPIIFGVRSAGIPAAFVNEKFGGVFFSEFDTLAETKAFDISYKTFLTNIGVI